MTLHLCLFFLGTILHLLNKLTDPFPLLLFTYNSNCTMYTFEIRSNCLNLLSKRFMKGILPPFENKYFDGKYKRFEKLIIMRRPSKCTGFMNHFIQDVLENKMRSFKTISIQKIYLQYYYPTNDFSWKFEVWKESRKVPKKISV